MLKSVLEVEPEPENRQIKKYGKKEIHAYLYLTAHSEHQNKLPYQHFQLTLLNIQPDTYVTQEVYLKLKTKKQLDVPNTALQIPVLHIKEF